MTRLVLLAASAALLAAVPANAATFLFTIATGLGSGSGSFTTVGDATTPTLVTAMAGSFGGNAISLLAPGTYPTGFPNTNLFTNLAPYFDFGGVSFTAGANSYNVYSQSGTVRFCGVTPTCSLTTVTSFTVKSAVPEPQSWALMLVGFGAIGATMRYRVRAGTVARA